MRDAKKIWIEVEDYLAPLLSMRPAEHVLYSHLLRRTHLEGRRRAAITFTEVGRAVGLCESAARLHLYSLQRKGCVVLENSGRQKAVEVLLPEEAIRGMGMRAWKRRVTPRVWMRANEGAREEVLRRERGRCFYCRAAVSGRGWFDHVVPIARGGAMALHNVVACCEGCNREKRERSARVFLRELLRRGRIGRVAYGKAVARLGKIEGSG